MFKNLILAWVWRRTLEIGGLAVVISQIYAALPPYVQAAIGDVLTGHASPQNIALAIGGIIIALWGYVWSFRSTMAPQVVTTDKQQFPLRPNGAAAKEVEALAKMAIPPKTLAQRIIERLRSN